MRRARRSEEEQDESPYAQWEEQAKALVLREMKQRKLGYKELARRLQRYGIEESAGQINRKVNRKRFSAAFLFACLAAMEMDSATTVRQTCLGSSE